MGSKEINKTDVNVIKRGREKDIVIKIVIFVVHFICAGNNKT